jgi:hypothetical protein
MKNFTFSSIKVYMSAIMVSFLLLFSISIIAQNSMQLPAHGSVYSGNTRGYWFVAPTDFIISGLRVPADAGTASQNIQLMKFAATPPAWAATTTNYATLGHWTGIANGTIVNTNILVNQGDIIGIFGVSGNSNSYATPTGPYTSSILGSPVTLTRLIYQGTISSAPAGAVAQEATAAIGRVELYYRAPTSGQNNAATLSVDSPTVFCAGPQDVVATIANYGTNQINSLTVNWEVNGVAQTPLAYTQLLDTLNGVNPYTAQVVLGTANFVAGSNTIKVYTSMPNGIADVVNLNDTASTSVMSASAPTAVNVLSATLNSATINAVGGAGTIEYEYGPIGFAQTTGTSGTSPTALFTITGLTASSTYDVYVRSNCGGTDASAWVGPITFNTAYGIPYFEDFELFTAGNAVNPWPRGWSSTNNAAAPRWESEDATGGNENSTATGPFYDNTTPSTAGGMYMYLETSGGVLGDTSDMVSPPIYIDSAYNNVLLEFYYHMYGADMGNLKLYVDTNGVSDLLISFTGQQQTAGSDAWRLASLNLVGYQGKSIVLRFSGVRGNGYTSDMSIDDIRLSIVAPLNAGVVEVQSPTGALCPGTVTPVLGVKNFGSVVLNNVKVMWEVNGVLDSLLYNTAIQPGDTASVTISPLTFNSTSIYDLKFFTREPNGMVDPIQVDDTLRMAGLRTGLSGTYTLDPNLAPSSTNFTSFSLLSQQLSNYGLCGPTTINVAAGSYTNGLELSNVLGINATNTLTIDGGDSSTTVISATGTDFAALTLSGVDYVTVKNMTLEYVGTAGSGVIVANANHNTVSNCIIRVDATTTLSGIYAISISGAATSHSTGAIAHYNTFSNNVIIGGYYGIRAYGSTTTPVTGTIVMNNEFRDQYYYGAYFYYGDSTEVIGNEIDMVSRGNINADGMYLYYTPNFKFNNNKISALDYGAYIYDFSHLFPQTRKNEIINNMIYSDNDYGLYMYYIDSTNIYHNTIVSNSTTIPAVQIYSSATIAIANYDMRNNILYSGGSFALRTNIADVFLSKMDHNAYYTSGNSLLSMNSTTYANLAAYVSANASFNANSFEGAPQFVTYPTDLHVISGVVSNTGDNTVGVMTDIDGDVRPAMGATAVDMGADEFSPPALELGLTSLQSPTSGCDLTNAETVTIDILNSGQNAASNYTVGYSVNGGAFVTATIAGPLASAGTQTYTFTTTANLSAAGPHTVKAFVNLPGDNIPSNDTIYASVVNTLSGGNPSLQTFDLLSDGVTDFSPINWMPTNAGAYEWRAETSTTSSTSTGPTADHTSGTGTYIYSEASSGTLGDTIFLESSCIDITPVNGANSSTRVDYWYHMYGADIVALGLQIDSAGFWVNIDTIIGQQQTANADTFRLRSLDLSAYQGMGVTTFRFWTIKGNSFNGDVAIDDFRVYDTVGVNAQMDSIISPMSNCGLSATSNVTVKISNVGLSAISNFPVSYVLNGGTPVTETVTATVIPGTSLNYTFTSTVNLQTVGSYSLKAYVAVSGDGDVLNDTVLSTVNSSFAQRLDQAFPNYFNDFEGSTNNWVSYGTNNSWEIGTPSTFYINKAANGIKAYVTSAASNHNANELSYIETPCFDLTYFTATDPIDISFDVLFKTQSDSDQVWMEVTMNNGVTWTKVTPDPVLSINFYNNTTDNTWDGFSNAGAGNYIPVLNSITGIGGNSQVKFRFVFKSNGTNENDGFALDNFRITTVYVGLKDQIDGAASFGLHPNPTRDNVTISFNNVETGNYNLTIEDVKGQKVVNEVITVNNSNSTKKVNTSQFEKGVYFVRLVNGSTIVTKKLVVN